MSPTTTHELPGKLFTKNHYVLLGAWTVEVFGLSAVLRKYGCGFSSTTDGPDVIRPGI